MSKSVTAQEDWKELMGVVRHGTITRFVVKREGEGEVWGRLVLTPTTARSASCFHRMNWEIEGQVKGFWMNGLAVRQTFGDGGDRQLGEKQSRRVFGDMVWITVRWSTEGFTWSAAGATGQGQARAWHDRQVHLGALVAGENSAGRARGGQGRHGAPVGMSKRAYITKAMTDKFGLTVGCPRCQAGHESIGV
jgi:hypothetical protein